MRRHDEDEARSRRRGGDGGAHPRHPSDPDCARQCGAGTRPESRRVMAALDFPNPPLTIGQLYNGTNGVTYQWDGTVWSVPVGGAQLWSTSGSALTPTDATKIVSVPGSTSTGEALRVGAQTVKSRLFTHPTA